MGPFKRTRIFQMGRAVRWLLISVISILLIFTIVFNFVFENYEVIGESINCTTNAPIDLNYTCKLEKLDNHTQYWSFEGFIPEGVTMPDMMARVTTYRLVNKTTYEPFYLKNATIDICKLSGGPVSKMIITTFFPDMIGKSNFNQPCPLSGTIYMRNFQFSRSLKLPRIVPGKWLLDFVFYAIGFEEISFNIQVYLEVKPIGWHLFSI